jgi:hypothetical protein
LITIFTLPKPFIGHIDTIQRNAIQSWMALGSACKIILIGNEEGIEQIAQEFRLEHIPQVERNEFGTPLLNSAFKKAIDQASDPLLCYLNSDIILLPSFLDVIRMIQFEKFLAVGQRWNIDMPKSIDFSQRNWGQTIEKQVISEGILLGPHAIDCFIFRNYSNDIKKQMPSFAVGRPGWDNWMIYFARSNNIPVIDVTRGTTIIHSNHDYNHVKIKRNDQWEGPEGDKNYFLAGEESKAFTIDDASYCIKNGRIYRAFDRKYIMQRVANQMVLDKKNHYRNFLKKITWRIYHLSEKYPNSPWNYFLYFLTP